MRRFVVNALAIIGALTLLGTVAGFVMRITNRNTFGTVIGPDNRPLPQVPIFLDRGSRTIERYLTNAAGRIILPLADRDVGRATWLICAPGAIPFVVHEDPHDRSNATYQYARLDQPTWDFYRAWGWRGPIPKECPTGGNEPMFWIYRVPGRTALAYSTQEPHWLADSTHAARAR